MKVFKKLIIFTLVLALSMQFTLPALAVGEGELTYTNMALNRPATASSNSNKAYFGADGVNVSEYYTYWEAEETDENPWWQVDLEVSYTIDTVEIEPRMSESASLDYEVWASNDKKFEEYVVLCDSRIAEITDNVYVSTTRSRKPFRYLRVVKTNNKDNFTIGEFRAIVSKDNIKYGVDKIEGSTQVPLLPEAGSYVIPKDVVGTSYEKTVGLLGALNIMHGYTDGNFMVDEPITRAEMATIAVRMLGVNNVYYGDTPTYSDVAPDHWAYSSVEIATGLEIINGMGDGSFMPNDKITTAQAVKIVVSVLGYGVKAMSGGGYPLGYMSVGYSLGLLNNIESGIDQPITRGEIARMVYRALHEKTVVVDSYTNDGASSAHTEDFLSHVMGIYRDKGQVTETSRTGLTYAGSSLGEDMIKIDDSEYKCLVPKPESYIGLPVEYYYKDVDGINTVVYMRYDEAKNIKTIDAQDVNNINTTELSYKDEKDKTKNLSIDGNRLSVIYNERAKRPSEYSSLSSLVPSNGTLTLVDADGNKRYEILIIKAYETLIVDRVSTLNKKIYFKDYPNPIDLENVEGSICVILDNKEEISWETLAEWDVVTLMRSADNKGKAVCDLIVSRKTVKGIVTENDATIYEVTIKGKPYKVLRSFYDEMPPLGSSGTYYLDAFGRICYFDGKEPTDGVYGYLIKTGYKTGSVFESDFAVKIFTQNGSFEEYICEEDVTVDNITFDSIDELQQHLIDNGRLSGEEHQVIKYSLNNKGKITNIDTKYDGPGETDKNLSHDIIADGTQYTFKGGVFDCTFSVDPDAVVMKVPDNMLDEKNFEILSTSRFQPETSHEIDAYDGGELNTMKLVLYTDASASTISNGSDIFLVEKVYTTKDSEGEFRTAAKGLYKGKEVSYFEADPGVLSGVKSGDILQISLTNADEIKIQRKLFVENKYEAGEGGALNPVAPGEYMISKDFPEYARTTDSTLVMRNNFYTGYGKVMSRDGNLVNIEYVTNVNDTIRKGVKIDTSWRNTYTYVYDSKEKTAKLATPDDIEDASSAGASDASMVFFFITAVEAKALIILK